MNKNWRASCSEAVRGSLFTVTNKGAGNLVRRACVLDSGQWAMMPPETIEPGATIQFGSVSTQWMAGTEGRVEYSASQDSGALVTIRFSNPYGFWKNDGVSFEAVKPLLVKGKSVRRAHAKGYMLEARVNVGVTGGSNAASPAASRAKPAAAGSSGTMAADTHLSWRERVASGLRGVFVTVINTTDATLQLATHDAGDGSLWAQRPAAVIEPSSRDTFATLARGVTGTSGTVAWRIDGCEKPVLLIWDNPYFGENSYTVQCPDQFRSVVKSRDAHCSGVVLTLVRRASALQGIMRPPSMSGMPSGGDQSGSGGTLEEPDDMDWARSVQASVPKLKLPDVGHPTLKLLSLACILLPPPLPSTPGDPLRRAQLLGAALDRSPYDLVCLQEVFWANARQALRAALTKTFPHVVDKVGREAYGVGVGSGLFVASKHPILWSQFFPFEEGIGSDSLASKGVLLLKVDVEKLCGPASKAAVYVVVTDLQSDPDDSLPWKLVANGRARAAQVRLGQAQMIGRMVAQQINEREAGKLNLSALILAGRLHMNVERRLRNEQLQWATTELIPHLADLLNHQKIAVVYASELMDELRARGFHVRFLGALRAATRDRRNRALLLVVMVCHVMQQDLWRVLRERVHSDAKDEERAYVDLCLAYMSAAIGAPSPAPAAVPAATAAVADAHATDDAPLPAAAAPAEPTLPVVVQPRATLRDDLWTPLLMERVLREFGAHSLSEDEAAAGPSFLRAQVLWFQLLRYFQSLVGVTLSSDSELDVLNHGVRPLLNPQDVHHVDQVLRRATAAEAPDASEALQVEQTPEYVEAAAALGRPRDAFREVNARDFGSDVPLGMGQMLGVEEGRKDVVLVFDRVPGASAGQPALAKLVPIACTRVSLMGDSGALTDTLTACPGVELVVELAEFASDDFTMI